MRVGGCGVMSGGFWRLVSSRAGVLFLEFWVGLFLYAACAAGMGLVVFWGCPYCSPL